MIALNGINRRIFAIITAVHHLWDWCCSLVTVTLEVGPFCTYPPLPALLPFLKCILDIIFCEGVQHRLRFYLDHLICVKVAVSSIGKAQESRKGPSQANGVAERLQRSCFCVTKFSGEKGRVRWYVVVTTTSSFVAKVWGEVFAHFHAVAVEYGLTVAWQDEFLMNSPLDTIENDEHVFDFALHRSPLSVSVSLDQSIQASVHGSYCLPCTLV
jgi:hypothetical protein